MKFSDFCLSTPLHFVLFNISSNFVGVPSQYIIIFFVLIQLPFFKITHKVSIETFFNSIWNIFFSIFFSVLFAFIQRTNRENIWCSKHFSRVSLIFIWRFKNKKESEKKMVHIFLLVWRYLKLCDMRAVWSLKLKVIFFLELCV